MSCSRNLREYSEMLSEQELKAIREFINSSTKPWIWVDITTTDGPTRLENSFKSVFRGNYIHHWSPALPEGYLEIREIDRSKNMVIHWVLGERDALLKIQEMQEVDFDEIDDALSSTIIQNSVIRLFSEKF